MGDIAMVADGQWGAGAQSDRWADEEVLVEHRVAEGRHAELTVEELARVWVPAPRTPTTTKILPDRSAARPR